MKVVTIGTPSKSIKKAPTIGTTKYAFGDAPYFFVMTSKSVSYTHLRAHET